MKIVFLCKIYVLSNTNNKKYSIVLIRNDNMKKQLLITTSLSTKLNIFLVSQNVSL